MNFCYRFPVVRGIQAETKYYIAMVPLKMLSKMFPVDDEEFVLPEYRAQRKLNEARIPIISRYILDNRDSYVFSALAASIDGEFVYEENEKNPDTGVLEVSMDAHFLINDGQHRKSAILKALREDPTLENETISIVFYSDQGLKRSQQIFTDLNKNAVKTSNSISELYDSRDEMAVITRNIIWNIEFLNTYTDKEKDILGKYSSSLFTLNTFYTANKYIVGRNQSNDCEGFLITYWTEVVNHMKQWQELQNHEITKIDLRENFIATQSIVIQAFGRVGNYFYNNEVNLEGYLEKIEKINWSRNAKQWYLRAVSKNGRIITNKKAAMLIANVIKSTIGIPLTQEENNAEESLKKTIEE
ncbi:DNA sulfur modification protein DndB [Clostridium beijerinckii]|uniref:DNA sulfur modification protein DndB n=1 Tax=Clostridium beijerinckii TaxID=1520 RepID=A0A0B5QQV0_CLOBE|nr:DNA sulfur modification protein DndB [Clostridium beijerinckii]AJG99248.1 DNA sulfur modification protein DndB [Clostridium beijerinckii]